MQFLLVLLTILLALGYLARQFYIRFFSKESKCDGCAIHKTSEKIEKPF